ncbi:hypothetical protein [Bradyrhizobium erythrophlei]|uniref:hypothetical protein n=1 Tax=Bradyrhizobium erythrophlei TaxID=1437360 RepID=UPI0030B8230E
MQHLAVLARDGGLKELIAEGVTREHRDVESVQEVRLPARFQTGASGHTSDPTACLTPSISANAASKNSSIF